MFFEAERQNFFRPLNGKRRELVSVCLRWLYERLHGPGADYSQNLTREALRDLISPSVQSMMNNQPLDSDAPDDELSSIEGNDEQQLAGALIRSLLRDGWLETFGDRVGLVTAYRFTRAGKLFAEALWAMDRPSARARQRNMRSCRNALEASLKNFDAYDLIDAYDHSEKVISDLAEGVDYFQELMRKLMVEASLTPWAEFMGFLDRFEKEFKKQLTADNVERHRQAIRETLHKLRCMDSSKYQAIENQLNDVAAWAAKEKTSGSTLDWVLDRIEDRVEAACATKQPELIKAMNGYMRRATSIVQQAMLLRSGTKRNVYSSVITHVAALAPPAQDAFLSRVGHHLEAAAVRVLDPSSFKLRSASQRRKALTITLMPKVSRDSRLSSVIQRAEANAFAMSNDDVRQALRSELRLLGRPFRLSALPAKNAGDILQAMQAVEAVRAHQDCGIKATQLPTKLMNEFYTGNDYQIELTKNADKPTTR